MQQSLQKFFERIKSSFSGDNLREILSLRDTRVKKPDGSYLTQGDLLCQDIIISLAKDLIQDVSFVSEELEDTASIYDAKQTVLVVDPIDGTENFTSGLPEWGISISAYCDEVHLGSLIGCPELNSWIQTGQQTARFQSRIRGLSSSLNKHQLIAVTEGFEYRIMGCCVYNMMNVIRGSFHSFENPKGANSWDILAGLNLALERNLHVTVEGEPYAGQYLPANKKYRFAIEN